MHPQPRWLLCCVVLSLSALAHEPDGGDDDDELDGGLSRVVVPPHIVTAVEALYPPGERRDAHVHLELQVDARRQSDRRPRAGIGGRGVR